MNYRHAFHAGNFADVVKHAVLSRILVHLARKDQPFRVVDTHAGTALYDLNSETALRTGEWRDGIARLREGVLDARLSAWLAPYMAAVAAADRGSCGHVYPGSPLIALSLMRPVDRLIACEFEPGAAAALAGNLRHDRRAKAITMDGWVALNAYVPPKERRGLVVIDPPFERRDEFEQSAAALAAAWRKWPTGIYLLWYPIKDRKGPQVLAKALQAAAIPAILRVEVDVGGRPDDGGRLHSAGLLIVNPPWRLADELAEALPVLAATLGIGEGVAGRLDWVATER
jgi:23S rRNA (adenine2030-N6)-methyltransferase